MPSPRAHSAFAHDGKTIYLFGGVSEQGKHNDMFQLVLDGKSMWRIVQQKGELPPPRDCHTFIFVASSNVFYLFGGSDKEDKQLNDFYTFDGATCTWKVVKSIDTPAPRSSHVLVAVGSAIYMYGGFMDGAAVGDM